MRIKNLLPSILKRNISILYRRYNDFISGDYKKIAKRKDDKSIYSFSIALSQPVKQSAYFENKVHNIRQGIKQIEQLVVFPGEMFSFWFIVNEPTKKNNYRVGRNIISSKLSEDYGGGLCQLSSIIYHSALIAGLKIIERHNHSVDIYKETERFTPLGADAAVVFGYKDLRIQNKNPFPIKFCFSLINDTLTCDIQSLEKIEAHEIFFEKEYNKSSVKVFTKANTGNGSSILNESNYSLPIF